MTNDALTAALDDALLQAVTSKPGVQGVCALLTDRRALLYGGVAGKRLKDGPSDITLDSVFAIFSATKAITTTLCLQLMEEGLLDLDAPAMAYAPALARCQVIDGFDDLGQPRLRPPKRAITTRMLLLHTAGFGYDYFNETCLRLARDHGQPSVMTATSASLMSPLLFDPGDAWEYGTGVDWAGQVVEAILGERLGQAMKARVFDRLGMAETGFTLTPAMRQRLVPMHQRNDAGELGPLRGPVLPPRPQVDMGGHGLYATLPDYARFIRMWLNDGDGVHGRVLRPETVAMAEKNGLGNQTIKALPAMIPALTNRVEFFPGLPKLWGLGFMINDEAAPTGRPAGSLGWAGMANVFYWIDRRSGIGGIWATQILPFMDAASLAGYLAFETAVYQGLNDLQKPSGLSGPDTV